MTPSVVALGCRGRTFWPVGERTNKFDIVVGAKKFEVKSMFSLVSSGYETLMGLST